MIRISRKKVLTCALYSLGGIFLLASLVGSVATDINPGTIFTFCIAAAILLFAFFFDKLHLAIRIAFLSLLTIGLLFTAFLPIYGSVDTVDYKEDAVIVLGAGLNGETPSKSLLFRLETAYDYAQKNPQAVIVVSGGQGEKESIPESTAMKRYLVQKGIDEERIIEENQSTNTEENLIFSKEILDNTFENSYRVAIISNDFHILRSQMFASSAGFASATHLSSRSPLSVFLPSTLRECVAVIYYGLF